LVELLNQHDISTAKLNFLNFEFLFLLSVLRSFLMLISVGYISRRWFVANWCYVCSF